MLEYGPKSIESNFVQDASSGDESEVETTGLNDERITVDGKYGPRLSHVVEEILELNWIYLSVSTISILTHCFYRIISFIMQRITY